MHAIDGSARPGDANAATISPGATGGSQRELEGSLRMMRIEAMRLPSEIDQVLKHECGACHCPMTQRVTSTLGFTADDLRTYLGTYWPRSFVESHEIMSSLLNNSVFRDALQRRDQIRILDIGAGTGGNLAGLLWAMKEACLNTGRVVDVVSVDGNAGALAIQKQLIARLFGPQVQLRVVQTVFDSRAGLERLLPGQAGANGGGFDVIISSKFVNEFYRTKAAYERNSGMYAALLGLAERRLLPEGVAILVDVNDKCAGGFFSEVLNREMNEYTGASPEGLAPILPLPCLLWHGCCASRNSCFSQAVFGVSHSMLPCYSGSDLCKVTVRVMARRPFAKFFRLGVNPQPRYTITWSPWGYDSCGGGVRRQYDKRRYTNGYLLESAV